jgi:hypothetical protein
VNLISFPAHALLIVQERLREQEAEGVGMPEGMELDELALRMLLAALNRHSELPRAARQQLWAMLVAELTADVSGIRD